MSKTACDIVTRQTIIRSPFFHSVNLLFVKLKYNEYKMHIREHCILNDKKANSIQACLGHNGMLNIGLLNLKTPGGS